MKALDVLARRYIRRAFIGWQTLTVRLVLQLTRFTAVLPASRETQDRAMYAFAVLALVVIAMNGESK